jgi:hypothetical protein
VNLVVSTKIASLGMPSQRSLLVEEYFSLPDGDVGN